MARPVTLGMINVSMKVVPLEERRRDILRMIDETGRSGCQIVLTPEFSDHHRTPEAGAAHSKGEYGSAMSLTLTSPFMQEIAALAKKHRMIVIPDVMLNDNGRRTNSAVVFGPDGIVLGRYDKAHLAPGEAQHFEAGDSIKPVATPYGNLGLLICYDMNFPENSACHAIQGADVLLWTSMRFVELEEGMYRARLPGRCIDYGLPLGVATYVSEDQQAARAPMSSIVYNALGQVVAGGGLSAGIVRGTIDLDQRPLARLQWGSNDWYHAHSYMRRQRRPELYASLTRTLTPEEKNTANEPAVLPAKSSQT
jgi:deaminated glutathione amidase